MRGTTRMLAFKLLIWVCIVFFASESVWGDFTRPHAQHGSMHKRPSCGCSGMQRASKISQESAGFKTTVECNICRLMGYCYFFFISYLINLRKQKGCIRESFKCCSFPKFIGDEKVVELEVQT